jgi:hypothetical protein
LWFFGDILLFFHPYLFVLLTHISPVGKSHVQNSNLVSKKRINIVLSLFLNNFWRKTHFFMIFMCILGTFRPVFLWYINFVL